MSRPDEDREMPTELIVRDGAGLKLRCRKLRIEVVAGPAAGQVAEVSGPEVRVGSGRGSQVVLLDQTVSRHHLTLRLTPDAVGVIDAGSRNGTFVDGVRVREGFARPESVIELGSTKIRLKLLDAYVDVPLSGRDRFGGLIGTSVAMRTVFTLLERAAEVDDAVLIEGETGTGKEVAAEAIHEESARSAEPFVVFDCSAVSPTLIESELFGHVRGAFSGAVRDREGVFEAADRGTLFLDEIGELAPDLQPKLLRALERGEVRPIGTNDVRKVDVRVIAATNRNLVEEVARRRFREDLYYRLAVVCIAMPPLAHRREDVPLLIAHFAEQARRRGGATASLPPETAAMLCERAWPGNVRELRNAVMRALALGTAGTIPAPPMSDQVRVDLDVPFAEARDRLLESFESAYLAEALARADGNATRAAEIAGVNRKFMQRAIKRHDLRRKG
jgi:transcriptional regulator with GAF, ATPase, and Fis domain